MFMFFYVCLIFLFNAIFLVYLLHLFICICSFNLIQLMTIRISNHIFSPTDIRRYKFLNVSLLICLCLSIIGWDFSVSDLDRLYYEGQRMILSNQFLIQIHICCFLSCRIKRKDLFKPYLIIYCVSSYFYVCSIFALGKIFDIYYLFSLLS